MSDFDFIIAGAGLAGAAAALALVEHGSVLVVERATPAAGGSGAAAGMVNPILGIRARPVWRIDEALPALDALVSAAAAEDLYGRRPTLRPADGDEQVERFQQTAEEFPEHAIWLSAGECAEHYPVVEAPEGALLITTGGAVDLPGLVERIVETARQRGAKIRIGRAVASYAEEGITLEDGERVTAGKTILALGRGYAQFAELRELRLHQVKGQTIRLSRPPSLPTDLPHVAGSGYVAHEDGALVAGSTYEHEFDHLEPTARQTKAILTKVRRMLPLLNEAEVLEERAGVRVTVPGIRLPMVGPLPGRRNVWIFTGFGAKGLLTAPLAARELPDYLGNPERIPRETRVR